MGSTSCGRAARNAVSTETFDTLWKLAANGSSPGWAPKRMVLGCERTVTGGGATWRMSYNIGADERELTALVFVFETVRHHARTTTAKKRVERYRFLLDLVPQFRRLGYEGDV
jgi:hypothetical protein